METPNSSLNWTFVFRKTSSKTFLLLLQATKFRFIFSVWMTHSHWSAVWTLCSASSQVNDVHLLRQAHSAPACTAWHGSEALQDGLHRVSCPDRKQLTWTTRQRPCSAKKQKRIHIYQIYDGNIYLYFFPISETYIKKTYVVRFQPQTVMCFIWILAEKHRIVHN